MDGGRKGVAKIIGTFVCLSPPATDLHLHNLLSPENRRQTTCQTSEAAQRATYHQRTVRYHNYVCGVVQAPRDNAEKGIHSVRERAKSKKSITTHAKMRDTCFSLEARMYSGAFAASMIGRGIKAPQLAELRSIYRSNYGTRTLSIPDCPTAILPLMDTFVLIPMFDILLSLCRNRSEDRISQRLGPKATRV